VKSIKPILNSIEIVGKDCANPESLKSKDSADTVNILRERLATLKQRRGRSAEKFFTEFFAEHRVDDH